MISGESHYSCILPVPLQPIRHRLLDVLHWAKWCPAVVNCAVLENPSAASTGGDWAVGSIRRSRMTAPFMRDKVIREEVVLEPSSSSNRKIELGFRHLVLPLQLLSTASFLQGGRGGSGAVSTVNLVDEATRQRIVEDVFASPVSPNTKTSTSSSNEPCSEMQLFPINVSSVAWSVRASSLTDSVIGTGAGRDPGVRQPGQTAAASYRTFIEFRASIEVGEPEKSLVERADASRLFLEEGESVAPPLAIAQRVQKKQLLLVEEFYNAYFTNMCDGLWQILMQEAFPVVTSKIPMTYRTEYDALEPKVLSILAARKNSTLLTGKVVTAEEKKEKEAEEELAEVVDRLFRSWESHARDNDANRIVLLQLQAELAAANKIISTTSQIGGTTGVAAAAAADPAVLQQPSRPASGSSALNSVARRRPFTVVNSVTQTDPETAGELPRPPFFSQYLRDCVASGVPPSDGEQRKIFAELDATRVGYLTDREIKKVLLTLEQFGTLEDKTGVTDATEVAREELQDNAYVEKKILALQDAASAGASCTSASASVVVPRTPPALRRNSSSNAILIPLSPRVRAQQLHDRANDKLSQRRDSTFDVLAMRWVDRHSRREKGKVFFEEFSLLLLQLCRQ